MTEWLDLMLEEIARKNAEHQAAAEETERRSAASGGVAQSESSESPRQRSAK